MNHRFNTYHYFKNRFAAISSSMAFAFSLAIAGSTNAQDPSVRVYNKNELYPNNVLAIEQENGASKYTGRILVKFTNDNQHHSTSIIPGATATPGTPTIGSASENNQQRAASLASKMNVRNAGSLRNVIDQAKQSGASMAAQGNTQGTFVDDVFVFESSPSNVPSLIQQFKNESNIEYVQADSIIQLQYTPNDPYFGSSGSWNAALQDLWGLHDINADEAWDLGLGDGIVVAVVDSGVDFSSFELSNARYNSADIYGNGIDDDNNGYIDDYSGWNFVDNTNNSRDFHGHGTHVTGTIAARIDNNIGIVGVAPNVSIMPIQALSTSGRGSTIGLLSAFLYAVDNGADVINNSWGGPGRQPVFADMIEYAKDNGVISIFSAGNSRAETLFFSPSGEEGAITVAASDVTRNRVSSYRWGSNWGYEVDIAAPGSEILSLNVLGSTIDQRAPNNVVDTYYLQIDGTSMSAPHVTGVVALMLEQNPNLTNDQIRSILKDTAGDWDQPQVLPVGEGIIDAYAAVNYVANGGTGANVAAFINLPVTQSLVPITGFDVIGNANGPGFDYYEIAIAEKPNSYGIAENFQVVMTSSTPVEDDVLANIDTTPYTEGLHYALRLRVYDTNGTFNTHTSDFVVEDNLKPGWPKYHSRLYNVAQTHQSTIVDLDGDGINEVVASVEGQLFVYDQNSELKPGYPVALPYYQQNEFAIGDVNGDSTKELFYYTEGVHTGKILIGIDHNGNLLPGFPAGFEPDGLSEFYSRQHNTPTLSDIDGDGVNEIIQVFLFLDGIDDDNRTGIVAFEGTGEIIPGFPIQLSTNFSESLPIVAADINNDGASEIIAPFYMGSRTSRIFVLSGSGTILSTADQQQISYSRGIVGTRKTDSNDVLIATEGSVYINGTYAGYGVEAFEINAEDFSITKAWDQFFSSDTTFIQQVQAHDMNQDGSIDIIAILRPDEDFPYDIAAFDQSGQAISGFPISIFGQSTVGTSKEVTIYKSETYPGGIIVGAADSGRVSVTDLMGNNLMDSPYPAPHFQNTNVDVGDLEGDGTADLVATNYGGNLYAWELGSISTDQPYWRTLKANLERTSFLEINSSNYYSQYPSMHLRGNLNGWESDAMTLSADNTWSITVNLSGNTEFKFDVYGDWNTNFGDNNQDGYAGAGEGNISINATGEYIITFNDSTLEYTIEGGEGFPQINIRGTNNAWALSPMTMIGNGYWQAEANFGNTPEERFKFDIYGDWTENYGDDNADNIADLSGGDIYITQGAGSYLITINENTLPTL